MSIKQPSQLNVKKSMRVIFAWNGYSVNGHTCKYKHPLLLLPGKTDKIIPYAYLTSKIINLRHQTSYINKMINSCNKFLQGKFPCSNDFNT